MLNRSALTGAIALAVSLFAFGTIPADATSLVPAGHGSVASSNGRTIGARMKTAALPEGAAMAAGCGKWCVKVWRVCVCV